MWYMHGMGYEWGHGVNEYYFTMNIITQNQRRKNIESICIGSESKKLTEGVG